MRKILVLTSLLSNTVLAGVIGGGSTPPAREVMHLSSEEFKSLALESINNPDMPINISGKLVKPVLIDLKTRIMRFESTDQTTIIDVGQQLNE